MTLPRPRLLPFTIFVLLIGLGARLGDLAGTALAEDSEHAAAPAAGHEGEAAAPAAGEEGAAQAESESAPSAAPIRSIRDYSAAEIQLLGDLAQRRRALDEREDALRQREALLQAAEQSFDEKMTEMTALRDEIHGLLDRYNDEQDAQLDQLVSIYEKMKAKDAATIFNTLDMEVLLEVISRMSENKSSAILAEMDPARANEVTRRLAERRNFPAPEDVAQ
jgi:flagellar motility protein MotE (MotC chaperone)